MGTTKITAEPGQPTIEMSREFAAPRELLFRAHTEPDLLVRWLGPRKYKMDIERYEVRDGGRYRYVHRDDAGNEFGFHGVFHGDPSPDGIVQTFEFEGWPGQVSLERLTLEEHGGRTTVKVHSVYPSVEARDAMVASGMETGVEDGYARLDDLLAELTGKVPAGRR